MINFKKVLALLLSITMVLGLGVAAFAAYKPAGDTFETGKDYYIKEGETYTKVETPVAENIADYYVKTVSISVSQDSTFAGEPGDDSRELTYKWIFRATKTGDSKQTGGGYDGDGNPLAPAVDPATGVGYSYFLLTTEDAARIDVLGEWKEATYKNGETQIADSEGHNPGEEGYVPTYEQVIDKPAHWEKAEGNKWFKLTPSADGTRYIVEWDATTTPEEGSDPQPDTDSATVQAAAKWLALNYTPIKTGTLDWDSENKKWTADDLDEGYYLIESVAGDNLIAATTDIEVKEKNDYPSLDKTQKDEDATEQGNETVNVAIGDKIDYEVKVTIPLTAKIGDKILVWDKASTGLTYNKDVAVKSNEAGVTVEPDGITNYTGDGAVGVGDAGWEKLITVTDGSQGKTIVFKFSMTVNDSALVDTDKKNESGLKYGREGGDNHITFPYESKPDEVEYKTYFAGIHKIDGDTDEDLAGVEFNLYEGETKIYVKKVTATETTGEGEEAVTVDKSYYIPCGESDEGATDTLVTDSEGMIRIRGLDEDKEYKLFETKTLDGYNLLDEPVDLTLTEDTVKKITYTPVEEPGEDETFDTSKEYYKKNATSGEYEKVTVTEWEEGLFTKTETGSDSYTPVAADKTNSVWGEVENNTGTILPSTGGIGTTIFYIVGGLLAVGAGVVLVAKKRMGKVED